MAVWQSDSKLLCARLDNDTQRPVIPTEESGEPDVLKLQGSETEEFPILRVPDTTETNSTSQLPTGEEGRKLWMSVRWVKVLFLGIPGTPEETRHPARKNTKPSKSRARKHKQHAARKQHRMRLGSMGAV